MDFISFDLETTGTLSQADYIVEIAGVRFQDNQPTDTFQSLVSIPISMPKEASDINGITDKMLKNQPAIEEILPDFVHFCGDSLMVAHNASFDYQFLVRAITEHGLASPKGIVVDTCNLARKTFPGIANYKLATLCELLKISSEKFHRAEEDARCCGELFIKTLERLPFQSHDITQVLKFAGRVPLKFPIAYNEGQMSLI